MAAAPASVTNSSSSSNGSAVAAGLNLCSLSSALPSWLGGRLNSMPVAKILQNIESSLRQIEQTTDQIASKFNANEDMLDGFLADLSLEQSNA